MQCSYLVFNVDTSPWILSSPVSDPCVLVSDGDVGADHGEGEPLPHPVVFVVKLRDREVVNLNLMFLKLKQDLENKFD